MRGIQECFSRPQRPIRVLQFGEGNFLRAFADWMIDILNEQGRFDGGVAVVKPIPQGSLDRFRRQDNLYTVSLRGNVDGRPAVSNRVITSLSRVVDPYADYTGYAALALIPTLRFVLSNTTEAGIAYDPEDRFSFEPPRSFPGKVTKLLYERAAHFDYAPDKGLILLPVELIDDNGGELKKCVLRLAREWRLGDRFLRWIEESCVFASTLVDRIVTGYPRDEAESIWRELGYRDELLVAAEPFGLWVIESPVDLSGELPLPQAGLPVIYTDDQKPYKQRKVRILNGAHTSFVPAAYLAGHDTVRQAMEDPLFLSFMRATLQEEVIPTLNLPRPDLTAFAGAVELRFNNPFVQHRLLSITLNSVSKWRARCLPSLTAYVEKSGRLPERLAFSLAALLAFYRGAPGENGAFVGRRNGAAYPLVDEEKVIAFFCAHQDDAPAARTAAALARTDFWGADLTQIPGLEAYVARALADIQALGMRGAMEARFSGKAAE